MEEEPPAKLLDDLFRKTKALPCIYWLPLTDEQVLQLCFICYAVGVKNTELFGWDMLTITRRPLNQTLSFVSDCYVI